MFNRCLLFVVDDDSGGDGDSGDTWNVRAKLVRIYFKVFAYAFVCSEVGLGEFITTFSRADHSKTFFFLAKSSWKILIAPAETQMYAHTKNKLSQAIETNKGMKGNKNVRMRRRAIHFTLGIQINTCTHTNVYTINSANLLHAKFINISPVLSLFRFIAKFSDETKHSKENFR